MWQGSGKPGPGRGEGLPEAWTPWGKSSGPKHAPRPSLLGASPIQGACVTLIMDAGGWPRTSLTEMSTPRALQAGTSFLFRLSPLLSNQLAELQNHLSRTQEELQRGSSPCPALRREHAPPPQMWPREPREVT